MQKFTTLTGVAAPLPMINVDTDKIIPKQHLKTIARTEPATLRPSTISAASRRSSMRELVQEPMKTRSGETSVIGVPGSSAM